MELEIPTTSFACARARAFTLVELCLSLVIISLIGSAIAAFLLSVSSCWTASENLQTSAIYANQFTARLCARLNDAKRIGTWVDQGAGDPGMIYWRDINNDGIMTYSELGVIQYNSASRSIDLYTAALAVGDPDEEWTGSDFLDKAAIIRFIDGLTPTTLIRNVPLPKLAITHADSETIAPTVSWTLELAQPDGGTISSHTAVASLRGPATPASK